MELHLALACPGDGRIVQCRDRLPCMLNTLQDYPDTSLWSVLLAQGRPGLAGREFGTSHMLECTFSRAVKLDGQAIVADFLGYVSRWTHGAVDSSMHADYPGAVLPESVSQTAHRLQQELCKGVPQLPLLQ